MVMSDNHRIIDGEIYVKHVVFRKVLSEYDHLAHLMDEWARDEPDQFERVYRVSEERKWLGDMIKDAEVRRMVDNFTFEPIVVVTAWIRPSDLTAFILKFNGYRN
jgi:hypothetical protein